MGLQYFSHPVEKIKRLKLAQRYKEEFIDTLFLDTDDLYGHI